MQRLRFEMLGLIEDRAKGTNAPALIYQEAELPLRVTRDLFTSPRDKRTEDYLTGRFG